MMKKINAVDALFLLGALCVALGMGLWLGVAAALITAGAFLLLGSFLSDPARGGTKEGEDGTA